MIDPLLPRRFSVWDIEPPRTILENVRFRQEIRRWALKSETNRRALIQRCSRDFVFFCETFLWIYEPRPEPGRPQVIPFLPWSCQYPVIEKIIEGMGLSEPRQPQRDVGLEKSRGEGASWMVLMIILWRWIFGDMEAYGLVSRNELAADSPDDPDSLGWKIDWQLKQLPLWLTGRKSRVGHPGDWDRNISKHTWVNNNNGCTITAYPATGDLASGGRKTAFLMDELSKFPRGPDEEAMAATEPVSNCRIIVATPNGADGAYYRCMTEPSSMIKLILDWTKNQTRNKDMFRVNLQDKSLISVESGDKVSAEISNKFWKEDYPILSKRGFPVDDKHKIWSPWYVSRCVRPRMTPKKIAQEYDRDYGGSSSRFFPSVTIEMLIERARPPKICGELAVDEEKMEIKSFTKMKDGRFRSWVDIDKKPPPGEYIVACDIATGQGGSMSSNSTITIINKATGVKVAAYASPTTKPEKLAELAVALCRWYKSGRGGEAYLIFEANGPGQSFRKHIIDETDFRNFYYRQQVKKVNTKDTKEPGWWSGKDSKRELLGQYRHALTEGFFDNPCEMALRETLCYVEDTGGKVKFMSGLADDIDPANEGENHGDRVIADALANHAMVLMNGSEDPTKIVIKDIATGPPQGSFLWRRKQNEIMAKQSKSVWVRN